MYGNIDVMIQIKDKNECCGCSACVQRCPKRCISLEEDKEGFLYPNVDEINCINCGVCEKVCHELHPYEEKRPIEVYAAINKDEEIRLNSSSGGIFYLMAENTIKDGGVVFGAKFDKDWQVVFDYSETYEGCKSFMGSKYVQANVDSAFKNAECFLKRGRKVLFSGTPCQIAALHHFLRKEYPNLYTVDFVCHGVPSPKVWRLYLKEVMKKYNDIHNIEFRNKRNGWKDFYFVLEDNAKDVSQSLYISHFEDPYMKAFLENMSIRPSCYNCKAKQGRSNSDITIADFWGIWNEFPQIDDDKGTSLILINTPKGHQTFDWSKISKIKTSFDAALKYNMGLNSTAKPHNKRALFFSNIDKEISIIKLIDRCLKLSFKKRLWNFLSLCKIHLLRLFAKGKSGGARCQENDNELISISFLSNAYISDITFRKKKCGWQNYGLEITLSTKNK